MNKLNTGGGEENNESGGEGGGGGGEAKPKLITQVSTETINDDGVSSPSEEKIGKRTVKDWKLNEQLSMEEVVDPGNNGQVVAMEEEEEDEDEVTCDKKEALVSQYKSTSINSRRSGANVQEEEEDYFFVRDKNDETPKKKLAAVSAKKVSHKPLRFRPSTTAKLYKNKLACALPTCAAEFLTQHQLWRHSLLSHGSVVGQKLNRQLREMGQQQQQQLEHPCGQCQHRRRGLKTTITSTTTFPLSIARSTYRFYMNVASRPPRALPATTLTTITTATAAAAAQKLRRQKTVSEIPTLINMNEPRLTRKRSSMALGLTSTTEGTAAPAAAAGSEQKHGLPGHPPSGANARRPKKYRNFCKVCSVGFPKQRELKAHYQSKDHREKSNATKNAAAAAKTSTRLKVNGLTTTTEAVQPQTPKGAIAVVVTKTERQEPTFLPLAPPPPRPSLTPRSPRVRTPSITAGGAETEPRSPHSSGNLTCGTCHTSFWSTYELKRHYATLKHQQAVAAAGGGSGGGDKEETAADLATGGPDNEIYECETCETGYQTESQLKRHCSSIVHQNRVADRAQTGGGGEDKDKDFPFRRRYPRTAFCFNQSSSESDEDSDDSDTDSHDKPCAAVKCLRPKGGTLDWIFCNSCEYWFHLICVSITSAQAKSKSTYTCEDCLNVMKGIN